MAGRKGGAPAPRPRSGFVREDQRGTERLTLRLRPEVMSLLHSLATEVGEAGTPKALAATIEQALHALNREMQAESDANEEAWNGGQN